MPEITFTDGTPAATPDSPAPSTPTPSTTEEAIAALDASAAGPQEISIDGQTTREHSLPDQIEYLKYKAANAARRRPGFGIGIAKLVPHGAVLPAGL